jgi:hypothetical protein
VFRSSSSTGAVSPSIGRPRIVAIPARDVALLLLRLRRQLDALGVVVDHRVGYRRNFRNGRFRFLRLLGHLDVHFSARGASGIEVTVELKIR